MRKYNAILNMQDYLLQKGSRIACMPDQVRSYEVGLARFELKRIVVCLYKICVRSSLICNHKGIPPHLGVQVKQEYLATHYYWG